MKPTGRLLALLLVLGLAAGACTGGGDDGKQGDGGGTPDATESAPPLGSGEYRYQNAGLTATMSLDGTSGTLEIQNETGRELPKPDFYILDARDGTQIDGKVDGAAPVAAGDDVTFDVSFAGIDLKNIGLLVLLMGRDNYGAFSQQ
jgi:hypothetical protein